MLIKRKDNKELVPFQWSQHDDGRQISVEITLNMVLDVNGEPFWLRVDPSKFMQGYVTKEAGP